MTLRRRIQRFMDRFARNTPVEPLSGEPENVRRTWTTEDGRIIKIIDLSDDHLRNIIFFLHRRLGEINSATRNRPISASPPLTMPVPLPTDPGQRWNIYDALIREADRRRLSWVAP